jgi:hypothetical protein
MSRRIEQLFCANRNLGGGAAGIVIVSDGSPAYVAVSEKDKVAFVDLTSLEVTG